MRVNLLAFIGSFVLISGCSTTPDSVEVLLQSDPQGATIYQNGSVVGRTPTSVYYAKSTAFDKGGCRKTTPLMARWASGAVISTPISLCSAIGLSQIFTFHRPNVEGRESDERFAIEVESNNILQRQANAAQTAADAAVLQWLTPKK